MDVSDMLNARGSFTRWGKSPPVTTGQADGAGDALDS
jgi:hypothetical protein